MRHLALMSLLASSLAGCAHVKSSDDVCLISAVRKAAECPREIKTLDQIDGWVTMPVDEFIYRTTGK